MKFNTKTRCLIKSLKMKMRVPVWSRNRSNHMLRHSRYSRIYKIQLTQQITEEEENNNSPKNKQKAKK